MGRSRWYKEVTNAFIVIIIFVSSSTLAQQIEWIKTQKGSGPVTLRGLVYDLEGFIYEAGYFTDTLTVDGEILISRGFSDIFILKYDTSGNVVWKKQIGSGAARESLLGITVDEEGYVYITGSFRGSADFDGINLNTIPWDSGNAFVAKLTSEGDMVWAKDIGGDRVNLNESGYSIDVDNKSNVYVTGLFQKTIFVCKLDSEGKFLWIRYAGGNDPLVSGDIGHEIVVDSLGNSYVVGHFLGRGYFGKFYMNSAEGGEGFLAKYNPAGVVEWVTNFEGYSPTITLDKKDDIIMTGFISKGSKLLDYDVPETGGMVAKINSSGELYWLKVVPNYRGYDIEIDQKNNILLSGDLLDTVTFNNKKYLEVGKANHMITSFSTNGDEKWAFTIVDSLGGYGAYNNHILLDKHDNIYYADAMSNNALLGCQKIMVESEQDPYLIKINAIQQLQLQGVANVCLNEGSTIALNTTQNTLSYQWIIPDSLKDKISYINDSTLQAVFSEVGEYTLSVNGILDEHCDQLDVSEYLHVKVHPPLSSFQTITGRNAVCPGQRREQYGVEANPYVESYEWILPEGITVVESNENKITVDFTSSFQAGEIKLRIKNYCDEVELQSFKVSSDLSVSEAQAITGPNQLCIGDQNIIYTVPEIDGAEAYRWELPYGWFTPNNTYMSTPIV